MQNWIGGSDYSPRGALHVPPSPDRVPALMDDLLVYLNREDIPILVQSTIAHSQFESIDRLMAAGIIEEITGREKNRAWAASEVLAELDDPGRRIQDAMP